MIKRQIVICSIGERLKNGKLYRAACFDFKVHVYLSRRLVKIITLKWERKLHWELKDTRSLFQTDHLKIQTLVMSWDKASDLVILNVQNHSLKSDFQRMKLKIKFQEDCSFIIYLEHRFMEKLLSSDA